MQLNHKRIVERSWLIEITERKNLPVDPWHSFHSQSFSHRYRHKGNGLTSNRFFVFRYFEIFSHCCWAYAPHFIKVDVSGSLYTQVHEDHDIRLEQIRYAYKLVDVKHSFGSWFDIAHLYGVTVQWNFDSLVPDECVGVC